MPARARRSSKPAGQTDTEKGAAGVAAPFPLSPVQKAAVSDTTTVPSAIWPPVVFWKLGSR